MHQQADIRIQENKLILYGDVCFWNVMSVYEKSIAYLSQSSICVIDFSQLHSSDSSGLALIVDWLKWAEKRQKSITLQNVPPFLLSLMKTVGIDRLF
jgi:phospholipid transport system transporter-binding protein